MAGAVRVETEGALGWIVFDHLARHNAITAQMWEAIPDAARRLAQDPAVRVVILRGAGEAAFLSGADISEFERMRNGPGAIAYDAQNTRAFEAIAAIDKPVLAMIHGFCMGGGTAIALQADLRYAADDALLAIPAAKLGLGYSPSGIDTLVRLVGPSVAKDVLFTARRIGAEEALRLGLLNAVLPKAELETWVRRTAETIAANAPLTLASVKRVVRNLARGVAAGEDPEVARSVRACFDSEDYREGVRAFLEKRPPRFHGR
jgi:enoyl-CoA hydratase